MKEYTILQYTSIKSLEEVTNNHLRDGYLLAGGVSVYYSKEDKSEIYTQAIYKFKIWKQKQEHRFNF